MPNKSTRSHHAKKPAAAAGSTAATTQSGNANARSSRLPPPSAVPNGILLDEIHRLNGIVTEQRRLLAIAEANYERHLGRVSENLRLDSSFAWEYQAGFMIPAELTSSSGMAMTAGAGGSQGGTGAGTGD